jgi:apolipoprotein D and lipocalin family protein
MKPVAALLTFLFAGCVGIPENIKPVENFKVEKYLGKWYEIARLDHSFEKGLTQTTAQYSLRDDGGVRVINRGYLAEENKWKEAEGKAFFVEDPGRGYLKVSFFGPFYGSYIVFDLDDDYQHSLVCGPDKSYLWILSRTPALSGEIKDRLVSKASTLGFDTGKLIYVEQKQ